MSTQKSKTIKTTGITDVISITQQIGDNLATHFNETQDIKVAAVSLSAYKTAISAAKAQLIYKKLTGNPSKINFLHK